MASNLSQYFSGTAQAPSPYTDDDDLGPSVSMAVEASTDDEFHRGSFQLKRTTSMGKLPPKAGPLGVSGESETSSDVTSSDVTTRSASGTVSAQQHKATPHDDNDVEYAPERHVDYLSSELEESDLSKSWRYIIILKRKCTNPVRAARLENASWRNWAKARNNLRTVSPESVNWHKDVDVTWLYGPLFPKDEHPDFSETRDDSSVCHEMPHLSERCGSDIRIAPKPILKRRTVGEMFSERDHLKLAQHIARSGTNGSPAIETYDRDVVTPVHELTMSDPMMAPPSILSSSKDRKLDRHIHFNDRVEQCIALSLEEESSEVESSSEDSEEEEEEEGLFIAPNRRVSTGTSDAEPVRLTNWQTIEPLPATTLNYGSDEEYNRNAISHNVNTSRGYEYHYDYNTVYTNSSPGYDVVDVPECVMDKEYEEVPFSVGDMEYEDVPYKVANVPYEDVPYEVANVPFEVADVPFEVTNVPYEVTNVPYEVTNVPYEAVPFEAPVFQGMQFDDQDYEEVPQMQYNSGFQFSDSDSDQFIEDTAEHYENETVTHSDTLSQGGPLRGGGANSVGGSSLGGVSSQGNLASFGIPSSSHGNLSSFGIPSSSQANLNTAVGSLVGLSSKKSSKGNLNESGSSFIRPTTSFITGEKRTPLAPSGQFTGVGGGPRRNKSFIFDSDSESDDDEPDSHDRGFVGVPRHPGSATAIPIAPPKARVPSCGSANSFTGISDIAVNGQMSSECLKTVHDNLTHSKISSELAEQLHIDEEDKVGKVKDLAGKFLGWKK